MSMSLGIARSTGLPPFDLERTGGRRCRKEALVFGERRCRPRTGIGFENRRWTFVSPEDSRPSACGSSSNDGDGCLLHGNEPRGFDAVVGTRRMGGTNGPAVVEIPGASVRRSGKRLQQDQIVDAGICGQRFNVIPTWAGPESGRETALRSVAAVRANRRRLCCVRDRARNA